MLFKTVCPVELHSLTVKEKVIIKGIRTVSCHAANKKMLAMNHRSSFL
jgi:hypothetical protein